MIDMLPLALIGAAAAGQAGGDLLSGAANYRYDQLASAKAYERQQEMMQNAHQWEVKDLEKAGLNPILSATGGSGAHASAPAVASSRRVDFGNVSSSAMSALKLKKELEVMDAQKANLEAQAHSTTVNTDIKEPLSKLTGAITGLLDRLMNGNSAKSQGAKTGEVVQRMVRSVFEPYTVESPIGSRGTPVDWMASHIWSAGQNIRRHSASQRSVPGKDYRNLRKLRAN